MRKLGTVLGGVVLAVAGSLTVGYTNGLFSFGEPDNKGRSPAASSAGPLNEPAIEPIARARPSRPVRMNTSSYGRDVEALDIEWQKRNGYPSAEVQARITAHPPSIEAVNAADGLTPEEAFIVEMSAMLDPSTLEKSMSLLSAEALNGSTYALEAMGRILGYPDGLQNPVQAEAYFRAAEMRGNWSLAMRPAPPLSREYDILADLMAHQVLNRINNSRRAVGKQPLGQDPRPGLNEILRRMQENASKR